MMTNQAVKTIDWLLAYSPPHSSTHVLPDVKALTAAVAAGDTDAFAVFYRDWFNVMYQQAQQVSQRDESFCLDIVQDAMLKVIKSIKPMNSADDLRRWLHIVVKTCTYDRFREQARRIARERKFEPAQSSKDQEIIRERLQWLERELRSMDRSDAELLLMRHRFGWTLKRIGQSLGLKPGAVDGKLQRLVRKLRRRAKEQSHD
ncbi:MAG: sigma-70 family RNA polymerase sigma factor [Planctomycetes bacterium]|nr:sigma-70 family RNA polymerase sigma factor [Planctomycetota bacterium]